MESYGGFWVRFFAQFIDSLILLAICMGVFFMLYSEENDEILIFVLYLGLFLYTVLFVASQFQATPGKMALKIFVGNEDGSQISFLKSFARELLVWVFSATVILGIIDVLVLIFSSEKASLHDKICKTRVFYK